MERKRLYETITAENWTKGMGVPVRGQKGCVLGHAAVRYPDPYERARVYERIVAALRALSTGFAGVGAFNDHPDTTIDDVLRVLKFADV